MSKENNIELVILPDEREVVERVLDRSGLLFFYKKYLGKEILEIENTQGGL